MLIKHPDWDDLRAFMHVAERQSFTLAGKMLRVPKSTVSRRVAALESALGVQLLQRSARHVSLTDAGRALLLRCQAMQLEAESGLAAAMSHNQEVRGVVRISMPVSLAELFAPHLLRFASLHPDVRVAIVATNRAVNLIEEGVDLVVRGLGAEHDLEDSSLVQAAVCTVNWRLVATPGYLRRMSHEIQSSDLSGLDWLVYAQGNWSGRQIRLIDPSGDIAECQVHRWMQSDSLAVLKRMVLLDGGVCGLPDYLCQAEMLSGMLVQLLPGWRPMTGHLKVLLPSRRRVASATRALVEFIKAELPHLVASDVRHGLR